MTIIIKFREFQKSAVPRKREHDFKPLGVSSINERLETETVDLICIACLNNVTLEKPVTMKARQIDCPHPDCRASGTLIKQ